MKFRGQRITLEDERHIRAHIHGLRRTLYNMTPENPEEKFRLKSVITFAEALDTLLEQILLNRESDKVLTQSTQ